MSAPLAAVVVKALNSTEGGVRYGDDWKLRVETVMADPPQSRFINNAHRWVDHLWNSLPVRSAPDASHDCYRFWFAIC